MKRTIAQAKDPMGKYSPTITLTTIVAACPPSKDKRTFKWPTCRPWSFRSNWFPDRTTKASQLFIATIPILAAYPFLQRFFVKGLILGSVKG